MLVYQKVMAYLDEKRIKKTLLSKQCNIPLSTFNAMLDGNRTMYADDLRLICYALDVSPELFINCEKDDST